MILDGALLPTLNIEEHLVSHVLLLYSLHFLYFFLSLDLVELSLSLLQNHIIHLAHLLLFKFLCVGALFQLQLERFANGILLLL